MSEAFDIQEYMTKGVERVVADAVRATLRNPRESAFMVKFAAASRKRCRAEKAGEHIPPFLIASITSQCNLHCAGCYSRCNHAFVHTEMVYPLYEACPTEKRLLVVEGAGHGSSYSLDPDLYFDTVFAFIEPHMAL